MDLKGRSMWLLGAAGLAALLVFFFLNLVTPIPAAGASAQAPAGPNMEVNSNADDVDAGGCQSQPAGDCTLREAILAANSLLGTDQAVINFELPPGSRTILLGSALPSLTRGRTTIDGYSQSGASPATRTDPASILIRIDCANQPINGFNILSANNIIKGLAITNCGSGAQPYAGVSIYGAAAANNVIAGNYIGATEWGSAAAPNAVGVYILDGAQDNTIGGSGPEDRNLISGNLYHGVSIMVLASGAPLSNTVSGNYIGLDREGDGVLANGWAGVYLGGGTKYNRIGGDDPGERNVISGNNQEGVYISGLGTDYNRVSGNYIGPDKNGDFLGIVSQTYGVRIDGKASRNWVGGESSAERNVIGQSKRDGVRLSGSETISNTISNNYIGIRASGQVALSNAWFGVTITNSASLNQVGPYNFISGNELGGVRIYGGSTFSNTVSANVIGVKADGSQILPNMGPGVVIEAGAQYNRIGGDLLNGGNLISGNLLDGVAIDDSRYNEVYGNLIGTTPTGGGPFPNFQNGVNLTGGARYNQIGGLLPEQGNLISGNIYDGIRMDELAIGNEVLNNLIGVNLTATAPLPNSVGVHLLDWASSNHIGGDYLNGSNLIGGNNNQGVLIEGEMTENNDLDGNSIGIHPLSGLNLGNGAEGVLIQDGAIYTIIQRPNVIAHNGYDSGGCGVMIVGADTRDHTIAARSIFANQTGGICLEDHANRDMLPPAIASVIFSQPITITGTTCPDCRVRLYNSPEDSGQGRQYVNSSIADGVGNFTITTRHIIYPYLTATATDTNGSTSEFSAAFDSGIHSIFLPMLKH